MNPLHCYSIAVLMKIYCLKTSLLLLMQTGRRKKLHKKKSPAKTRKKRMKAEQIYLLNRLT